LAFFAQATASFCKNCDHNMVFEKNANFFAENWQKSQKIVIITSTPGSFTYCIICICMHTVFGVMP
jgi:hypothetical protein